MKRQAETDASSFDDALRLAKRLRAASEDTSPRLSASSASHLMFSSGSAAAATPMWQQQQQQQQLPPPQFCASQFMRMTQPGAAFAPFMFPMQQQQQQPYFYGGGGVSQQQQQLLQPFPPAQFAAQQQLLAALAARASFPPNRQPFAPLKPVVAQPLSPPQPPPQPQVSALSMVPLPSRRVRAKPAQKSRFRGTYWDKAERAWAARVMVDGKAVQLGVFDSELDAARAYDVAVVEHHGTDAESNFPPSAAASAASAGALTDDGSVLPDHPSAPGSPGGPLAAVSRAPSDARSAACKLEPAAAPAAAAAVDGRRARGPPSSSYRGVCWNKCNRSWKASIKVNGKNTHIGYFDDVHEAALAYDLKAIQVRGDRAVLNFRHGSVLAV